MYYGTPSSQIEWNNQTSLHDSSSEINDESIATNDKYENQWPFLDTLQGINISPYIPLIRHIWRWFSFSPGGIC